MTQILPAEPGSGTTPDSSLEEADEITRAPGFWREFGALFRSSALNQVGVVIVGVALVLAAIGPLIVPFDPMAVVGPANQPPSAEHWFGTDASGMDVFSRVISAPRIDVTIAIVATLLSAILGTLIGLLTSFFQNWSGRLVMRFSDIVQSFPLFVLAIIIVVMGRSADASALRTYANIVIVVMIFNVPIYLRLIRSEVLSIRNRTFVEAARANGDSGASIAFRHVLPNAINPGFAQMSITLGQAIIVTGGLSFIGAGVQPPTPEWGAMINAGKDDIILGMPWTTGFPGAAMALTVFGFAVLSDMMHKIVVRSH